ncbi:MAG: chorismate synthase [Candidatus Lokiarchaeota archaeon]|nr:chorismate synthase [Candidatus Lokiarchaeota archaeon]
MTGNTFGTIFKITTWGESHGKALGVIIDGCPAGLELNEIDIQMELDKRKPKKIGTSTTREEKDQVEILSGVFEGKTIGSPISLIIFNKDIDSSKYESIKDIIRPSHADFTFIEKYGIRDWRGGGRSSGRETVSRVAGGAIAKKILKKLGINIISYTIQFGTIKVDKIDLKEIDNNPFKCPNKIKAKEMEELVNNLKQEGDSTGGIVEIMVQNIPIGLGEPVFDKLSADLAKALMSIGSIKGVEIGDGFQLASMKGSEANDEFIFKNKKIGVKTNHSGGIQGGISNGADIILRVVSKPIASISKKQSTVNIKTLEKTELEIQGRHDISAIPRINAVCEAMVAICILDHYLRLSSSKIGNI